MKFIIKPFSEIMVKSKPVRKRYMQTMQYNLHLKFRDLDENIKVWVFWDKLELNLKDESIELKTDIKSIKKVLSRTPGIESFLEVEWHKIESLESENVEQKVIFDEVLEKAADIYLDRIKDKTFVTRVKRSGKHWFKSTEIERYVGAWLLIKLDKIGINWKVNLRSPEVTVKLEIKDSNLYVVKSVWYWIGWYPTWTQDKIISLISGWFDSWVSTFSLMKRWCKVDFLFFNLWGSAHELWVKQVAYYLNDEFSSWYAANIITVPFEDLVADLVKNVDHKYRAIILKRCMLKVADMIAKEHEYYAIVKWDSLGQVSSQTLKNMFAVDKACDTLVLRPLIWHNKQEIVDITKQIWTYDFACNMPEYCWVISDKPATWARLEKVEHAEKDMDDEILINSFNNKKVEKVRDILKQTNTNEDIDFVSLPHENDIIIDVRDPDMIEKSPLKGKNHIEIPFYEINNEFSKLDSEKRYILFCDKWIMSKLHWLYLLEKWFKNVAVFRPLESDMTCAIGV